MKRIFLVVAAVAFPLAVAASNVKVFGMTSHFGWYVTAATFGVVALLLFERERDGAFTLLFSDRELRARFLTLLAASAVVPLASELIVDTGRRLGLYRSATTAYLHVLIATAVLLVITIEVVSSMQRLERLRAESESRLRLHIDRMPVGYIQISTDFMIAGWSPAAQRIFGWTEQEIIGRTANVIMPGGGKTEDLEALWQRLIGGDQLANSINENVTKDGRTITCRWSNTPLFDANGRVTGVISMAEDITEEQRSQQAFRESELRYRALVDSLPYYVFSVDLEDRFIAVNKTLAEFFGRPESEIIGRTPEQLGLQPEMARKRREQKERTCATGTVQIVDSEFAVEDRQRKWRTITSPMRDDTGAIVGITGISIDTTEQRETEAAVQKLQQAIEQLEEVLFLTDRDGVITYVNPAFEKVYGYSKEEAVGNTPKILKSGEVTADQYRHLWSELLDGRSVRAEYKNQRKDGSMVTVTASATPLQNDAGRITGFVAVQQDITEQKRAAEERRALDDRLGRLAKMEALGTLAGGVAHDFNNILSIILTHATLLERLAADPARLAGAVTTIKQAVQRGAGLSRQILTFARRAEIKADRVDAGTLMMELSSMITETFPRTIHITIDFEPDLPPLTADAGQLHQALLNLCVNARDAMPDGGELRMQCRRIPPPTMRTLFPDDARDCDYLCLAVKDSGSGIDEQTRHRIFEPFFTTKPKGKGTGLGLAVVYGVVKGHDGLIDVTSAVGEGTTFRLYFPVAGEPVAAASPRKQSAQSAGNETLLVIDDEAPILEGLKESLTTRGYRVFTASDGVAAIETCARMPRPDAILMDLGMPKMSAATLTSRLQEVVRGVPIIAMTGYLDPTPRSTAPLCGEFSRSRSTSTRCSASSAKFSPTRRKLHG